MPTNPRNAYMQASVSTAGPQALLLMLCDRLVLDVQRAAAAHVAGDVAKTHQHLVHAQAIVSELATSLDPDGFSGGHQLAELYRYLLSVLVAANVRKDPRRIAEGLSLSTSIAEIWREAAAVIARTPLARASA
ncbi:MAG: flagellar export chaperone FliS [Actinomycetota bacterium]|nr:flagellar export chaperone FliS [Actinomycetota bacterium]